MWSFLPQCNNHVRFFELRSFPRRAFERPTRSLDAEFQSGALVLTKLFMSLTQSRCPQRFNFCARLLGNGDLTRRAHHPGDLLVVTA
jgi:hypothetical protein